MIFSSENGVGMLWVFFGFVCDVFIKVHKRSRSLLRGTEEFLFLCNNDEYAYSILYVSYLCKDTLQQKKRAYAPLCFFDISFMSYPPKPKKPMGSGKVMKESVDDESDWVLERRKRSSFFDPMPEICCGALGRVRSVAVSRPPRSSSSMVRISLPEKKRMCS